MAGYSSPSALRPAPLMPSCLVMLIDPAESAYSFQVELNSFLFCVLTALITVYLITPCVLVMPVVQWTSVFLGSGFGPVSFLPFVVMTSRYLFALSSRTRPTNAVLHFCNLAGHRCFSLLSSRRFYFLEKKIDLRGTLPWIYSSAGFCLSSELKKKFFFNR